MTHYETTYNLSALANAALISIIIFFGVSAIIAMWHGVLDGIYKIRRNKEIKNEI